MLPWLHEINPRKSSRGRPFRSWGWVARRGAAAVIFLLLMVCSMNQQSVYDLLFRIKDPRSYITFQTFPNCSDRIQIYRVGACKPIFETEQDCRLSPEASRLSVLKEISEKFASVGGKVVREYAGRNGVRAANDGYLPKNVWVLFDMEQFAFPACEVGEEIEVYIPSTERSLKLQVVSNSPRVIVADNFLTDEECRHLISKSGPSMQRSTVATGGSRTSDWKSQVRTSSSTWYKWSYDRIAHRLVTRVAELVAIPMDMPSVVEYGGLQVLHYQTGEYYWAHLDAFPPKQLKGVKDAKNRFVTVFLYLTDVEEGGETGFPLAGPTGLKEMSQNGISDCSKGVQVKPVKGRVAIFYNLHPESQFELQRDERAWHLGCRVTKGTKWAANFWILLKGIH